MSVFLNKKYKNLAPYAPGEQPRDFKYVKLNTNESPFPPSEKAVRMARDALEQLNLYPDPTCSALVETAARVFGAPKENIIFGNGSDELLYFSFLAYCDRARGAAFADVTYGFYRVFAEFCDIPYQVIPLNEAYEINVDDYVGLNKTVFIANPNAPTGIMLEPEQIERIVVGNPNNVVVVDEAYVDFGGKSCISLVEKYNNLIVIQTFSKSRSMAGARLGMAFGNSELIMDINKVRYSTNPYNINKVTMSAGIGALSDEDYTKKNCRIIIENRDHTVNELKKLGFFVLDSKTNFVFAKHDRISGEELYNKLKDEKKILVRHFKAPRINGFIRISIGTKEQMNVLIKSLKEIIEGLK